MNARTLYVETPLAHNPSPYVPREPQPYLGLYYTGPHHGAIPLEIYGSRLADMDMGLRFTRGEYHTDPALQDAMRYAENNVRLVRGLSTDTVVTTSMPEPKIIDKAKTLLESYGQSVSPYGLWDGGKYSAALPRQRIRFHGGHGDYIYNKDILVSELVVAATRLGILVTRFTHVPPKQLES